MNVLKRAITLNAVTSMGLIAFVSCCGNIIGKQFNSKFAYIGGYGVTYILGMLFMYLLNKNLLNKVNEEYASHVEQMSSVLLDYRIIDKTKLHKIREIIDTMDDAKTENNDATGQ